jgi:hypothetical protein
MAFGWDDAIFGALSIGSSILGASSQQSQIDAYNEQVAKQYKYDMQTWRFGNRQGRRAANWARQDARMQFDNLVNTYKWQDEADLRSWDYQNKMLTFDHRNQLRQFDQSEKNYKKQLHFNNVAAAQAYEAERNVRLEIGIGQAFDRQDMMVDQLMDAGASQVTAQPGRSAGKIQAASLATYGRNMAKMDESLRSADRQFAMNSRKIDIEKLGADLAAEAARMLKPEMPPQMPKPKARPLPKLHLPLKYKKPPKPIKGAMQSSAGVWTSAASSALSGLASMNWSGIAKSKTTG